MEAIALHSPRSPDSSPSFDRNDINPEYLKHSTNQALSLRSSPVAVALYDVALIDHIMRHAIEYASRLKRLDAPVNFGPLFGRTFSKWRRHVAEIIPTVFNTPISLDVPMSPCT